MRCALAAALLSLALASSWAQESPSSSIDSLPAVLAPTSPRSDYLSSDGTINWAKLDADSQAHLQTASELSASASETESKLKDLQTQYTDLLNLSRAADEAARKALARSSANSALWRVGALSGVAGLAGSLLDHEAARGAGVGAGIGALAAAVWWVVEGWPPWK